MGEGKGKGEKENQRREGKGREGMQRCLYGGSRYLIPGCGEWRGVEWMEMERWRWWEGGRGRVLRWCVCQLDGGFSTNVALIKGAAGSATLVSPAAGHP